MRSVSVQQLADHIELFRFEDYTFRLLMEYLLPEYMEELDSNYEVPTVVEHLDHPRTHKYVHIVPLLEEKLRSNPILVEFFGADVLADANLRSLLEPFKQHILPIYTIYGDIYGTDICAEEWQDRKPVVLTQDGRYCGHIYCYNEILDGDAEFIGIRESIYCTLHKLYTNERTYSGIAFSLLDGCKDYALSIGCTKIHLAAPIGRMSAIAAKYGFVNDELLLC